QEIGTAHSRIVAADVRRRIPATSRVPPPHVGGYGGLCRLSPPQGIGRSCNARWRSLSKERMFCHAHPSRERERRGRQNELVCGDGSPPGRVRLPHVSDECGPGAFVGRCI